MRRGLDHVVHLVRDLDAAGEVYDLLGFTVGARNRHPWGTENRIIQTPGFFIELLQVVEPEKIPPATETAFSFGAFNQGFLETNGEGLSMLALEGRDPAAEKASFDAAGFGGFDLFEFARNARRPDGQEVEVGFCLAFARDPAGPDVGLFTCTQSRPENFWSADLQRHSNQVTAMAGVVLVADVPAQHQAFLETVTGTPVRRALAEWFVGETPRGNVDVMSRGLFTERYGVPAPGGEGLRLAAVRFTTPGVAELSRALAARRMVEEAIEGVVVVPPRAALGATLVFEQATAAA
ncbi:VOC family protein [Xanthobacter dioxanivorans]|uniref:VOC family protein n=1 Tax=Xanthobacter dioxanivorans TaxID=2528964 RepID=A0A974PM18_9HYPH|nr:VOC family protein [Xanthobacter dioxanivorans]QRG05823.1 VOC family protein [Xanthobacter dioxanivorans]